MEDSVLDEIHQGSGVKIFYDGWKNEKIGAITDSKGNCIYRFIEAKRNNNGELVALHEKDEENPIVMVGIVSYWIKHRKSKSRLTTLFITNPQSPKSIREQFDSYTDLRYNQFKEQHADDPATWKYDWDYEFFCKYIVPHEMSLNKETEALYEFISDTDMKLVRSVMDNYIEYLKTRRTELGYHVSPELLVLRSIDSLNEFALEDLENFEISTIVDTLESEGYVKAAWVEGHRLESIRLLDKGKVYMKQLEEQEKNKQEPPQTQNAEKQESKFKTFIDSIVAHDEDIDEIFENDEEQNVLNQDNGDLLEDNKNVEGEEDSEDEDTDEEWDDQYDGVFIFNLKPQKIYIKLKNMNYPRVTDDYPRFFVFFRVLLYLGWIKNQQKNFLKWTKCHWNCNWKKEHNFKFSNNIKKQLRDTDMVDWDENTCKDSDIGKAYRDFAKKVLDVLAEKVNDGKIIDRVEFYKEGVKTRINDGRNLVYPF